MDLEKWTSKIGRTLPQTRPRQQDLHRCSTEVRRGHSLRYEMLRKPFRTLAGFGKRIEYWIIGRMLKEGLDVYLPLVDDDAVDALIRRSDRSVALVQIKARSKDVVLGDAALFAAIDHPEERADYWFVFYSERMTAMWIMTSNEFIDSSYQNKRGKNAGRRTIWFNGKRRNKATGQYYEFRKPQFEKYVAVDFSRIHDGI